MSFTRREKLSEHELTARMKVGTMEAVASADTLSADDATAEYGRAPRALAGFRGDPFRERFVDTVSAAVFSAP